MRPILVASVAAVALNERARPRSGSNAARRSRSMQRRGAAPHDPSPPYHEIAAEARMMSVPPGVGDSLGFEDLGDIGPAPPDARLSYYVEYGADPREPERRLFIACSASLPKLPKPPKSSNKPPTLVSVAKDARKAG